MRSGACFGCCLPEVLSLVPEGRANPVFHERVQLVNASNGAIGTRRGFTTVLAAARWPANLGNDLLDVVIASGQSNVVVLPETPRPGCSLIDSGAGEEGMDVGHDNVDLGGHVCGPVVSKIGHGDGQVALVAGDVLPEDADLVKQLGCREVLAVKHFVTNDDALEVIAAVLVEKVPGLGNLARVGRVVVIEPNTEPDLHVCKLQALDGVDDHLGLVAVGSVEADRSEE